ncbi:hypothetical protein AAP_04589 [Ascosphaera apis ARSEF 7405]|uniref:Uncharacterized protein n=1 Tax=Ascosphaera apis ARSEF 7405 TaxID=392613 RepID=A0A167WP49_9EURO|nr:hypothetical protein AAP_04589 [Ascosphaera apis ARSEF 7405]
MYYTESKHQPFLAIGGHATKRQITFVVLKAVQLWVYFHIIQICINYMWNQEELHFKLPDIVAVAFAMCSFYVVPACASLATVARYRHPDKWGALTILEIMFMGPWAIFTMGYSTVAPISCLSIDSILKNQQFCDSNDLPNGLEGDSALSIVVIVVGASISWTETSTSSGTGYREEEEDIEYEEV